MKPYNPLEKENLGKSVAESLLNSPPVPLGEIKTFKGAGIYAIYYNGKFEPYLPFQKWNTSATELRLPIYVGKAIPSGARKGNVDPEVSARGTDLYKRLEDHRKSVVKATNLEVTDFWCRYLTVDDIWIPLGESLIIQLYRPLWNSVVDGFGNHDPGSGRYKGARPSWDAIHPGRSWATKCAPAKLSEENILKKISDYWSTQTLVL
ncbi:Eco29kI family restriction endonuclease [Roseibacillus persicicus]|uniref:Type II restriction-modification system endonuclease n=1 Tax=Roseibacillus persicicus TaxID=454148 RepID=A0A918TE47_9BACT|nr:Eco29kI family restriction endonuclease [Roseibacillus persicicus]GHC41738.1 type II restriction-modification system endonuclease [Roseibacillus persicicus]